MELSSPGCVAVLYPPSHPTGPRQLLPLIPGYSPLLGFGFGFLGQFFKVKLFLTSVVHGAFLKGGVRALQRKY